MISHTRKAWGLLVLLIPLTVHAQFSLTGLERPLDVSMVPQYPAAGEEVRLSVSSYGIDLDRSTIIWFSNGREIARNTTETTVTAGNLGSTADITVVAEQPDGLIGSGSARIRPTEVDLIWNSDSYAPPYFEGRRLAGSGARIHAEALARFVGPGGTSVASENIVYTWYRSGTRIAGGRGMASIELAGPALFTTIELSVVAQSVDGAYIGRAAVRISGVDPSIELYENHPLFGVLYHRALTGTVITGEKEQSITAVPYFAHVSTPEDPSLIYEWAVADYDIQPDPEEPQTITVTSNGYMGPLRIGLDLTSTSDLFMKARGAWELTFSESSSFFGGSSDDPFARPE